MNNTEVLKKSSAKKKKKSKKRQAEKKSAAEDSEHDSADEPMTESSTEEKSGIKKAKKEVNVLKKKMKAMIEANKIAAKKLVVTENVLKAELTTESYETLVKSCASAFEEVGDDGQAKTFFSSPASGTVGEGE